MEISVWLGHALCATNTSLWLLYARSHAACHVPTAEMLQMDQKPQSQLFSLPFDFSSDLGEPHNLSPNSLSPLDHPLPYVLYGCCEYKSTPSSLIWNHFCLTTSPRGLKESISFSKEVKEAGSKLLRVVIWRLSEAVTRQQQNPCLPQSLLLANTQESLN